MRDVGDGLGGVGLAGGAWAVCIRFLCGVFGGVLLSRMYRLW